MLKSARFILLIPIALVAILGTRVDLAAEDGMEKSGDALRIILPAAAYGMTFVYQDPAGRNQFYKSFFTTLGVTYALKYSIDKDRPNGGNASFPSGHTAAAFSGAAFIQQRYGWRFGAPAYLAAAFVGWSRIETENHYPEDVFAAAAIGTAITCFFTKPYLDKIQVVPLWGNQKIGFSLIFEW